MPFCEFAGIFNTVGENFGLSDVPVCNSFKAKVVEDQLCYTVDPNRYMKISRFKPKELSLTLYINYNEDREMHKNASSENSIIVGTIGNAYFFHFSKMLPFIMITELLKLSVDKQYNLNNIKEISVTKDFLTLNADVTNCQNIESLQECQTKQNIDAHYGQCGCLPFSMGIVDRVNILKYKIFVTQIFIMILYFVTKIIL